MKNLIFLTLPILLGTFNLTHSSSVFPAAYWTDTSGVPIQAHGGGFYKEGDHYYWFGEDKTENSHHFRHINVYRSTDLVAWDFLGHALSATNETAPVSDIGPDAVVERPKVIYNQQTEEYVMWFHLDSNNYGKAELGVAFSKSVAGPYQYIGGFRPFGDDSRDMTVWVDESDPNRTAYVVYATRVNLDTVIAKLTPDYRNVSDKLLMFPGIHREAYAVFKTNGLYYIVMSQCTGWDPNPNWFMYAQSMTGPWSQQYQIAPTSSNTFQSQSNYVIPVGNGSFVFCGDRWNSRALSDSRYVWLPIQIAPNNQISIQWMDQWWIDPTTGNSGPTSTIQIKADNQSAILMGPAVVQPCSGCLNGVSVGYLGYEGRIRFENVLANVTSIYSILVSYASGDATPRKASVSVNGVYLKDLTFLTTGGGHAVKQVVFQAPLVAGTGNTLEFYNEGGWAPDFDYIKVQCYYANC